ncbi:unnamed protein product [Urochloa humidicola]
MRGPTEGGDLSGRAGAPDPGGAGPSRGGGAGSGQRKSSVPARSRIGGRRGRVQRAELMLYRPSLASGAAAGWPVWPPGSCRLTSGLRCS